MNKQTRNLFYLEELSDYEIADDYSDVRGWDVIDADSRNVGKVDHLLVSKKDERVVYLDVEVDKTLIEDSYKTYQVPASEVVHGFLNKDGEDHLILPIGMVSLDEEEKKVHTNQINYTTFTKAKRHNRYEVIDPDHELILFRHYIGGKIGDSVKYDEYFYKRKEFDNLRKRQKADKL